LEFTLGGRRQSQHPTTIATSNYKIARVFERKVFGVEMKFKTILIVIGILADCPIQSSAAGKYILLKENQGFQEEIG
jgi:hypothetical protein